MSDINSNIERLLELKKRVYNEHQRESQVLDMKYADIILKLLKEKSILQTQMQVTLNSKIEQIYQWLAHLKIQKQLIESESQVTNNNNNNNNNIIINSPIIINNEIDCKINKNTISKKPITLPEKREDNMIYMPLLSPLANAALMDNDFHKIIENAIKNVTNISSVAQQSNCSSSTNTDSNANNTRLQLLFSAIKQMEQCTFEAAEKTNSISIPFVQNVQTTNLMENMEIPSTAVLTTVDNVQCRPFLIKNKTSELMSSEVLPISNVKIHDLIASMPDMRTNIVFDSAAVLPINNEKRDEKFIISNGDKDDDLLMMVGENDGKLPTARDCKKVMYNGKIYFQCPECGRGVLKIHDLYQHIKCVHSDERPFVCSVCGKAFKMKMHLKEHEIIHLEVKPYACEFCEKRFGRRREKNKHCERAHQQLVSNSIHI